MKQAKERTYQDAEGTILIQASAVKALLRMASNRIGIEMKKNKVR